MVRVRFNAVASAYIWAAKERIYDSDCNLVINLPHNVCHCSCVALLRLVAALSTSPGPFWYSGTVKVPCNVSQLPNLNFCFKVHLALCLTVCRWFWCYCLSHNTLLLYLSILYYILTKLLTCCPAIVQYLWLLPLK